jgi:hypothetical protein
VAALIFMFSPPKAPKPLSSHSAAYEAGYAAGVRMRHLTGGPRGLAVFFWVLGTVSCLWGSRQKKTLDREVNASAILSQEEKRELQAAAKTKRGICDDA